MIPGKLYKTTKRIVLRLEDEDYRNIPEIDMTIETSSSYASPRKLRANWSVGPALTNASSSWSNLVPNNDVGPINFPGVCILPPGELVVYASTSSRTGNYRLVYGDTIWWCSDTLDSLEPATGAIQSPFRT